MFKWGGLVNIKWNNPFGYPNYVLTHDPEDELPKFGYMSKKNSSKNHVIFWQPIGTYSLNILLHWQFPHMYVQ
jgi:hypothetical protein